MLLLYWLKGFDWILIDWLIVVADALLCIKRDVADRRCDEAHREWLSNGSTGGMSHSDTQHHEENMEHLTNWSTVLQRTSQWIVAHDSLVVAFVLYLLLLSVIVDVIYLGQRRNRVYWHSATFADFAMIYCSFMLHLLPLEIWLLPKSLFQIFIGCPFDNYCNLLHGDLYTKAT